jgi:hypothetical protein
VFPFLAQVEVGTSPERAKEGSEFKGLLCRRPPFGPDFHQQSVPTAVGGGGAGTEAPDVGGGAVASPAEVRVPEERRRRPANRCLDDS